MHSLNTLPSHHASVKHSKCESRVRNNGKVSGKSRQLCFHKFSNYSNKYVIYLIQRTARTPYPVIMPQWNTQKVNPELETMAKCQENQDNYFSHIFKFFLNHLFNFTHSLHTEPNYQASVKYRKKYTVTIWHKGYLIFNRLVSNLKRLICI